MIAAISQKILTWLTIICLTSRSITYGSLDDELTLTHREKLILDEFRARVENLLVQDYMKHDLYLVHWLRANKFDLAVAERLLLQNLEWRRELKIDEIETLDWSDFIEEYPYTTDVYDKEGRPTLIFNFGEWDVRKAAVSGQTPRLILYWAKLMEELTGKVRKLHARNVTQCNLVVDIRDFNVLQHSCSQCIHVYLGFISLLRNHYPGEIHRTNLINAPRAFQLLLQTLEPVIGTVDGFKVYGINPQEWKRALLLEYSKEQLPPEFGGTNSKIWDHLPRY